MRSRFPLILAGLVALAVASLVMVGCSDDENPPTTNNDNHDELVLAAVTAQVNTALDSAVARFASGVYVIDLEERNIDDRLFGPLVPDSSNDPVEDSTYWWIFYRTTLASGLGTTIVDSVQYLDGTTPQFVRAGADAMTLKHHYNAQYDDTTVSHTDLTYDSDLHIDGIDGVSATVLGDLEFDIDSKFVSSDSTVRQHWIIQAEVGGVVIDKLVSGWDTGCPTSGAISISVQYTYKKGSAATETINWTYDVTFTSGSITVDVTNTNDLSTSYDEDICSLQ
jgi:hypothetical protein